MRLLRPILILLLVLSIITPTRSLAQTVGDADAWRAFVENVPIGTELNVRLRNGQRFRATIVRTTPDALIALPKTRLPVPIQPIAYDEIASLERHEHGGTNATKAAAIGVASGVGGFFAAMLLIFALVGD